MATNQTLRPAAELAALNGAHYPNESAEYRKARNALLAEEIEFAAISSGWRKCAGNCRRAVR